MTDPLAPMAASRPAPFSRAGSGRTALMILSAPGAGAARLARVLQAAGAVAPADPAAVSALNDRALAALGSSRDDPFGPRRRGEPPPLSPELVARARALLRTPEPHDPLLVLADPAQARLATLWTQALEAEGWRLAVVLLVRPPADAAAALAAEEGVARNRGLLLWGSTMLEAERASRGGRRVAVAYDRLLSDPEAELDRIERGLALRLPRRTWDSAAEIEALLREAHRPPAGAALPAALAPLAAFADHLAAAAADEPGNADVPAETERWFDGLSELAAPASRRAAPPPPQGAATETTPSAAEPPHVRDAETARAEARADAAEAQVAILQGALAVSRRRAAEAEALLQARATEASAGERAARAALAEALASREAAEAAAGRLDVRAGELAAQIAELDGRLTEADARADAVVAALQSVEAAHRRQAAELDDERGRHADARERLSLTGIANYAAQARVRELEARLRETERRRRWLSRLLGRA